MKEFIEYLVKQIVDKPDEVQVEIKKENEKRVVYTLKVSQEEIGKVIGKQGKTAQALRVIVAAAAGKLGKKALLEIIS
ncbi:MAG: KH domain-containing protein [Ignavibacteria bacterium]|nr:KH domain-containing protein [Ignavibacteria bacterium]